MSQRRIREWYEAWDGQVYVSFSGGKDSTVLLHMVREIYPDVPAVFVDTGLEYPEIREFVKSVDSVEWLRPKMNFKQVIEKYGWPVISKQQAAYIQEFRDTKSEKLRMKRWNGLNNGIGKISEKWKFVINAPFKVSDKCCEYMKKKPAARYEKATNRKMFTGEMAADGQQRQLVYLTNGCNAFDIGRPKSTPLGVWLEEDVWDYIRVFNVSYSSIYDMGEKRTGCVFCAFGVNLQTHPNHFERMKHTHPKLWEYCMFKLGMAEVLDYIGVEWGSQMEIEDYIV